MVQFAEIQYAPTLIQRPSEIRAISKLTKQQKRILLPVFRFRPWFNSRQLERSIEVLIDCMDGFPLACDLDDWWPLNEKKSPAAIRFSRMREDVTGSLWYEFVRPFEEVIPCIRLTADADEIVERIAEDWLIERGFGFLLNPSNHQHNSKALRALETIEHNNFFVVVDAGWSKDVLESTMIVQKLAEQIFRINPRAALFISSSSFPDSFGDFGLGDKTPLLEFELFEHVRRYIAERFNESIVKYSDWATTRPPSSGGGTWIPRIDIPDDSAVTVYRSRENDENGEKKSEAFVRIAKLIRRDPSWPKPPPSWGHYEVDLTAAGSEFGMRVPAHNTAARINMHMHHVLSRLGGLPPTGGEEPFEG